MAWCTKAENLVAGLNVALKRVRGPFHRTHFAFLVILPKLLFLIFL